MKKYYFEITDCSKFTDTRINDIATLAFFIAKFNFEEIDTSIVSYLNKHLPINVKFDYFNVSGDCIRVAFAGTFFTSATINRVEI